MPQPQSIVRSERYELASELGRGGMGVVYAAFDRARGHEVALKCLTLERFPAGKQRDRVIALFEREYHALSQLAHPHIICAYDYGMSESGPYYTMERLAGESLRARAPVDWRAACGLLRDVASALALVHSRSLVHRDVTPLNIHCLADGRAKLIDFGALMPAGIAKHLVGTPAFIAPECVHLQSLDGQTDLFSLGGCLYFAITGEHAYPARSVAELKDAWSTPALPPSQLVPDVPEALDELVLSLISLEASARPRTAADVYERLSALANLPRDEGVESAQAFLTRPALVGRDAQVLSFRQRAELAVKGTGSVQLVRGERGVGRSRLLDAAALEAKLRGFHVARAGALLGRDEPLTIARSLIGALASSGAELSRSIAADGLEDLLRDDAGAALDQGQRDQTLRRLTETLLRVSQREPCALIIDDLQAIDEASCALLAGLAERAHAHALWIVGSVESSAARVPGSTLELLSSYARHITLGPLDAEQTRSLLASMFGEAPNIDVLSWVMQRRCQGNPQELMEAARSLIERGHLRYAGGHWTIANAPEAMAQAIDDQRDIEQRLARLPDDVRELLEAIALDRYGVLAIADYPALLAHGDRARMHAALLALLEARWVALHEDGAGFLRDDLRAPVVDRIALARRRELQARLADACAAQGLSAVFEAYHRLAADQPERALAAMEVFSDFVEKHPTAAVLRNPVTLEITDAVSRMPLVPGAHPATRAKYCAASLLNALYVGRSELVAERLPETLRALAAFSGMSDYRQLDGLAEGERLTQALTRAATRCDEPGLGALDVVTAIRSQTQVCIVGAVTANFMADADLLDELPDLTPFQPLSPALAISTRLVAALSQLARGQTWSAWDAFEAVYAELRAPSAEQLEPLTRLALENTAIGYLCGLGAEHGSRSVLSLLEEHARAMPDLAENQRSRYCLALGDLNGAAAARKRFEVLSVRAGGMSEARILELPGHLSIYALCNDVLALRRTELALEQIAARRPGWRWRVALAKAQLARCRGLFDDGLTAVEPVLRELRPPHADWQLAAATHLELLLGAQRGGDAIEPGRAYLAQARSAQHPEYRIELALAQACAEQALHDEAESLFNHALAELQRRDVSGVLLGCAYEVGAGIALARADRGLFDVRAECCAEQYRMGRHPGLTARYNTLMREAERGGRQGPASQRVHASPTESRVESLMRLVGHTGDEAAFYRGVLEVVLAPAAAIGGVLYVCRQRALLRVAMAGALANRPDLDQVVSAYQAQYAGREAGALSDGIWICSLEDEPNSAGGPVGYLALDTGGADHLPVLQSSLIAATGLLSARMRAGTQLGLLSAHGSSGMHSALGASQLVTERRDDHDDDVTTQDAEVSTADSQAP